MIIANKNYVKKNYFLVAVVVNRIYRINVEKCLLYCLILTDEIYFNKNYGHVNNKLEKCISSVQQFQPNAEGSLIFKPLPIQKTDSFLFLFINLLQFYIMHKLRDSLTPISTQAANIMHKLMKFFVFFNLLLSCLAPSSAEPSFGSKVLNFLFPVVTVKLTSNATHEVYVKCGAKQWKDQLQILMKGDSISWQFREILFPLKWCFVHIDKHNQGVFWAVNVKFQCTHCQWSINDNGVFLYREKLQEWEKHPLFLGPIQVIRV